MAAQYTEIVEAGAGTYSTPLTLRGRINAYVAETSPAWTGSVQVQRRYKQPDGEWSPWLTVKAMTAAGLETLLEHESDVQFRIGNSGALSGGHPLMRLSL